MQEAAVHPQFKTAVVSNSLLLFEASEEVAVVMVNTLEAIEVVPRDGQSPV